MSYRPALLIALLTAHHAAAQFAPQLLQNDSYWGDGKAEFDLYDAQIVREGRPQPCEVVHILVRENLEPSQWLKPEEAKGRAATTVIKMNQIFHIPTGLFGFQQMHSNYWQASDGQLLKFSFTSNDMRTNCYKIGTLTTQTNGDKKESAFQIRTSAAGESVAESDLTVPLPPSFAFYDELPLRVRTITFAKPGGEFEIQLAPSMINSKKDTVAFKSARVSYRVNERNIEVEVNHETGTDRFALDADFPFLLREWTAADGNHLKLKQSIRVDYWNYNKAGDRERALKDPMLRHPD